MRSQRAEESVERNSCLASSLFHHARSSYFPHRILTDLRCFAELTGMMTPETLYKFGLKFLYVQWAAPIPVAR